MQPLAPLPYEPSPKRIEPRPEEVPRRWLVVDRGTPLRWSGLCCESAVVHRVSANEELGALILGWSAQSYDFVLVRHDGQHGDDELLGSLSGLVPRPIKVWVVPELTTETSVRAYRHDAVALTEPLDRDALASLETLLSPLPRSRPGAAPGRLVTIARGTTLALDEHWLKSPSGTVDLGRAECEILAYLVANRGCWVSTECISSSVLKRRDPSGSMLVWRYISNLRRKLGKYAKLLQSSRTRGYCLVEDAHSCAEP